MSPDTRRPSALPDTRRRSVLAAQVAGGQPGMITAQAADRVLVFAGGQVVQAGHPQRTHPRAWAVRRSGRGLEHTPFGGTK